MNLTDSDDHTPLHTAANQGRMAITHLLLKSGQSFSKVPRREAWWVTPKIPYVDPPPCHSDYMGIMVGSSYIPGIPQLQGGGST